MPENRTASPLDRALADVLVAAYKGKRMSQADLVERTGISTATMQRLMAGRTSFDVQQLLLIADAIGGKRTAEYLAEAEETVRLASVSEPAANVTPIGKKREIEWPGEERAMQEWDAVAKKSEDVIEIQPDGVTP